MIDARLIGINLAGASSHWADLTDAALTTALLLILHLTERFLKNIRERGSLVNTFEIRIDRILHRPDDDRILATVHPSETERAVATVLRHLGRS